jgi:hypothetical protein
MSTSVSVGINPGPNSFEAGRDAAFSAKVDLHSEDVNLAIVFASANLNLPEVLRGVKRVIKATPLVGATGAGVITNTGAFKTAVAVMLLASTKIKPAITVTGPIAAGKEHSSARALAQEVSNKTRGLSRHAFSLFSDSLIDNSADLLSGIQEVFGASFPIVGGLSADDGHFGKTYQFFQEQVLSYSAVGILWTGDCDCAVAMGHGWKPLGRPLTVTSSHGNRIKTIENKPAIKLYEDYFADNVKDLKEFKLAKIALLYPLGFYVSSEDGYILRNVFAVEEDGSLVCNAAIPSGAEVRLMIGTKDSLLEATKEAAQRVKAQLDKKHKRTLLLLVNDSFSRYKLLGRNVNREIEILQEIIGADVPIIGFYGFGEYAPLSGLSYMGKSYCLNESITLLGVAE